MKTLFRIIAAVSLMTVFSCAKEIEKEIIPVETPAETTQGKTYTMTVIAEKSDAGTRALSLSEDKTTLSASWAQGERVTVYNKTKGTDLEDYLEAQESGTSTTLQGTLTGTIEDGDYLLLKFCSPSYTDQDGTLEFIAANCDYATAEVEVSLPEGSSTITVSDAVFESQQAIVEFTLKESDGTAITGGVTSLVVSASGTDITVTPSSATDVLYVALPAIDYGAISLDAEAQNGAQRSYHKTDATFVKGKFYKVNVKMDYIVTNYEQLRAAICEYNIPEITLGADINYPYWIWTENGNEYSISLTINNNVTLNLNGHYIAGYRDTQDFDRIFSVNNGGSFTLNGPGRLYSGQQRVGGAISNYGTLVINDVIFSSCRAVNTNSLGGGALFNEGTLTLTGCTFANNSSNFDGAAIYNDGGTLTITDCTFNGNQARNNGGAIYNDGTLNMSGNIMALDNTIENDEGSHKDNIYLTSGKFINVTGPFTEGSLIGVTLPESSDPTFVERFGVRFTSGLDAFYYGKECGVFFSDATACEVFIIGMTDIGQEAWLQPYIYYPVPPTARVPYLNVDETGNHGIAYSPENYEVMSFLDSPNLGKSGTETWYVLDEELRKFENQLVTISGTVNIILTHNILWTNGISVPPGNTLHIWAYSKDGSEDEAGAIAAQTRVEGRSGIGGGGYVYIHGGTVVAIGGDNAAAISGAQVLHYPDDSQIEYGLCIYGGHVMATGSSNGAGIGGGYRGVCGNILITGGVIFANGGSYAAGIGAGNEGWTLTPPHGGYGGLPSGDGHTVIRITGGDVTAIGNWGAGIGGGNSADTWQGAPAIVYIDGGTVLAQETDGTYCADYPYGGAVAIGKGHHGMDITSEYLTVYNGAKVSASGDINGSLAMIPAQMMDVSRYRYFKKIKIEPCDHPGYTETTCPYCVH